MKKKLLLGLLFTSGMMIAQDPALLNGPFDRVEHKPESTDTCTCAYWINESVGTQLESSTISSENTGAKFDALEADAMYQELAVEANSDYLLSYHFKFNTDSDLTNEDKDKFGLESGNNSVLDIRVLKGSGYTDGYVPDYQSGALGTDSGLQQKDDFGYSDVLVIEDEENNLASDLVDYADEFKEYSTGELMFSTGDETSIALYSRAIGNNVAPVVESQAKDHVWSAGDQEVIIDYITVTYVGPTATASVDNVLASKLSVYPNPATGVVKVKGGDATLTSLSVYNMLGKEVYASKEVSSIDVSSFTKGVYFLQLNAKGATATKKLIVE